MPGIDVHPTDAVLQAFTLGALDTRRLCFRRVSPGGLPVLPGPRGGGAG